MKLLYLVSEGQLESVWQLIEVLSPPFKQSFATISIKFSLAAAYREVGYSVVGLKLPDNIAYGGLRNIKVSGDGLVALRLSVFGYNLVSDLLRQFSGFFLFSMLIVVHTVTQNSRTTPFLYSNWLNE